MSSLPEKRLSEWVKNYARSMPELVFVETGTYLGDTALWASRIASRVVTIELSKYYFERSEQRLSELGNVSCYHGDSGTVLGNLLGLLNGPLLLWLDGHYSFGDTGGQGAECPLLSELAALRQYPEAPCIIIDDARYFVSPPPLPHNSEDWPDLGMIFDALRRIDPTYFVVISEDAIVAVPKQVAGSLRKFLRESTPPHAIAPPPATRRLSAAIHDRIQESAPIRLHLGCGQTLLDGYVNVDFPRSEHNVMTVRPDFEEDIRTVELPVGSIDEIRLHHVFEHFDRVTALALLIRWHSWLKPRGILRIETPDFEGCVEVFASATDRHTKAGIVRHLAGDQAAKWAFHLDHWYDDRYRFTLESLGFKIESVNRSRWDRAPFLANIEVIASKQSERLLEDQLKAADAVLWLSTVDPSEFPTFEVWRAQLRALFEAEPATQRSVAEPAKENVAPGLEPLLNLVRSMPNAMPGLEIRQIHGYNSANRDEWVRQKASSVPAGMRVLDVGAGTCPYRELFSHCEYVTHDFGQYSGYQGGEGVYGNIDLVSDIEAIPAESSSFDVILCTEVLEHVPNPLGAFSEMTRLLRQGGRMLVTAPLGSGLHQEPYHYYGGYTPHWYRHVAEKNGLRVVELRENGGFFALLAQECARVAWTMDQYKGLYEDPASMGLLFGEFLPRFLYQFDAPASFNKFTAGYFVELVKV